jgi:hypothetical protein
VSRRRGGRSSVRYFCSSEGSRPPGARTRNPRIKRVPHTDDSPCCLGLRCSSARRTALQLPLWAPVRVTTRVTTACPRRAGPTMAGHAHDLTVHWAAAKLGEDVGTGTPLASPRIRRRRPSPPLSTLRATTRATIAVRRRRPQRHGRVSDCCTAGHCGGDRERRRPTPAPRSTGTAASISTGRSPGAHATATTTPESPWLVSDSRAERQIRKGTIPHAAGASDRNHCWRPQRVKDKRLTSVAVVPAALTISASGTPVARAARMARRHWAAASLTGIDEARGTRYSKVTRRWGLTSSH